MNDFPQNITNDETMNLPLARFGGRIVVVDDTSDLGLVCEDLYRQEVIGFDTETRPSFKAGVYNKPALLQLSTEDTCYLFRLSKMRFDKSILKVLEDKNILKVGAAVSGDLRELQRLRHFNANSFVDLQDIAAQWGIAEKSLRKMSAITLGMRISKAQRLTNWEASSLTESQKIYAATDAWVSLLIYKRLLLTPKNPILISPDGTVVSGQDNSGTESNKVDEKKKSAGRGRRRRTRQETEK